MCHLADSTLCYVCILLQFQRKNGGTKYYTVTVTAVLNGVCVVFSGVCGYRCWITERGVI